MLNVYMSRSYKKTDKKIFDFIVKVMSAPEIKDRVGLNIYESQDAPQPQPLHVKVERDILASDVVVAILSRRHRIAGGKKYLPPMWVVAEVAYALACHKRVLYFYEEGVSLNDLGLIMSENIISVKYSKSKIGQVELSETIKSYILSFIQEDKTVFSPRFVFRHFAKTIYVFPDGYGMSRYQIKLQPLNEIATIPHHFRLIPENLKEGEKFDLPTIKQMNGSFNQLLKGKNKSLGREMFSFTSQDESISWRPTNVKGVDKNDRWFEVVLQPNNAGKLFQYEWMWSSRHSYNIKGENWSYISGLTSPISSCVFVLKIRKKSPAITYDPTLSLVDILTDKPILDIKKYNKEVSSLFDVFVFKTTQAETQTNLVKYKLSW